MTSIPEISKLGKNRSIIGKLCTASAKFEAVSQKVKASEKIAEREKQINYGSVSYRVAQVSELSRINGAAAEI